MRFFPILVILLFASCQKEQVLSDLEAFENENTQLESRYLIACAAGTMDSFMGNSETPISIFYYNVDGASAASIYLKTKEGDVTDYANYTKCELEHESLFNGRMGRFLAPVKYDGDWMIVSYTTDSTYHISDPIRILASSNPTADISSHLIQTGDPLMPHFSWDGDPTQGNVIYFSLVFDVAENFISGTYTEDHWWQFYDLSNVVLNVTPSQNPTLETGIEYSYLNMGVDDDNWVRSFGSIDF